MLKIFRVSFFLLVFYSSAYAGEVLTPEGFLQEPVWTEEEKQAGISRRMIKSNPAASSLWILLNGSEKPHTHNAHDLTAVMVRGEADMHLGSKTEKVQKGDIIEVPRGVVHWAENTGTEPALVYAIFTPLLEGKDYQEVPA